jgi:DMSO/TMAO reductase YedYZ molybdopterin-dependent catalytic subunit
MQSPQTRRVSIVSGIFIGILTTIPITAILYAGGQTLLTPQPYFELFDRVSRLLPGPVITLAIDTMVSVFSKLPGVSADAASKAAEQSLAVLLFVILGGVFGAITAFVLSRSPKNWPSSYIGMGVAVIPLLLTLLMEGFNSGNSAGPAIASSWILLLYAGWGMVVGIALERLVTLQIDAKAKGGDEAKVNVSRRNFLLQMIGAAAGVTVIAWGAGKFFTITGNGAGNIALGPEPTPTPMPAGMTPDFMAASGTRLEVTPNNRFYRVDVNTMPPRVDPATWTLTVAGLVNNTFTLTYDQFKKMPVTEMDATLECISNPVGGGLMSSTHWTGVKLADLLKQAGVKDGVVEIVFTSADGYSESIPLESAMNDNTLIAYATNGEALAPEHGFPARVYTPNRYGMKNPKWLIKIEAVAQPYVGYWVERGWNKEAIVKSTSIIDAVNTDQAATGIIPMGGVAFAGSRGISKVEVQIDGGDWQPAQIKAPLSGLTWRLWRYDWHAVKGHHTVVVRATDGTGAVQIQQEAPLHPDGASGYVSQTFDIV